jgi:hypothetical protein
LAVNILAKKARDYMIQTMRVLSFRERILPDGIPRKICAWCKTEISLGEYPVTHGICPACVEKEMRRYLGGIGIPEEGSRGKGFF